ncbi:MAG: hypothetical protein LBK00_05600 [Treponema sp.]|jgi:hypothetical protein|nr:hypothetical protein [Treponema sp.]
MKQREEEMRLLALFREMESRTVRENFLAQAGAMVRAQRALKVDYGLSPESCPAGQGKAGYGLALSAQAVKTA